MQSCMCVCVCVCITFRMEYPVHPERGIRGGSDGKEFACNARDLGLIPRSGICPGEGNGYPVQYSCLEKSHQQGNLVVYSLWGHKELDTTNTHTHTSWHPPDISDSTLVRICYFFNLNLFLIEDNCFTILCWFLPYINMNQPQDFALPLPLHGALAWAPCITQEIPTGYLFYIW